MALRAVGVMLAAGMGMCDAAAQVAAVSYEDVRFQRYGVEDGLSQTSAVSMFQSNSTAMKAEQHFGVQAMTPASVVEITGVDW